ncbi:AAA family ATPase [Desulfobotulus mexicanus]|uniref:AAA domain-containing protein n=1 Tax=Desulfobotulus mexicanus TaxID=2586642 RepID=A0A5S5MCP4_9BACT|nr:AAA family ATPase [Desulfobotulus mexicanus]TYT73496.1 AAA domain-containing protein [Desulfobotulus mexicanus]
MNTELSTLNVIDMDAGLVFSGRASGRKIKGFEFPCRNTPEINPDYMFHDTMREVVVWFMEPSDALYVFGPCGSGKTSLIRQTAARLNYPVFDVTGHGRLEFNDLVGHLSLQDGMMVYQYGPLSLAMRYGGLFLLNEIDLLDPATLSGLNGILDGAPLCIPENGGEIIEPHPMFRLAATANTNGASDESGLYQGTVRQNLAFMDRFWLCEIGYPDKNAEKGLLARAAGNLPESIRNSMVDFAGEVRRMFTDGNQFGKGIEVTFSTRTLLRWADLTVRFQPLAYQGIQPVAYALDRALGFRAGYETRAMLHELVQRMFPHTMAEPGDGD